MHSASDHAGDASARRWLRSFAVSAAFAISLASAQAAPVNTDTQIRPYQVHVSDEVLGDLRKRVQATRWPDKETVNDQSQGVQLAKIKDLVDYWGSGYDWRRG